MKKAAIASLSALLLTGVASAGTPQSPQFRATLSADGHRPATGAKWRFTLRALDPRGRPVSGVAVVRVIVGGRVVDRVGWFRFRGKLRRAHRWSSSYRGSTALLQAKILGPGGTRTAGYAVRVRSDWAAKTGRPTFRMALTGAGHVAKAGTRWPLVVRAFDSRGRPVGGTVVIRIVVPGQTVDTLGWFRFRGTLRRTHVWPRRLRGTSALVEAKVFGAGGTRTAAYRVRVR